MKGSKFLDDLTLRIFEVQRLFIHFKYEFIELWQSILALFIAIWLIFLVDISLPAYSGLLIFPNSLNVSSILFWVLLFLARGLIGLYAVTQPNKNQRLLKVTSFMGISLLTMVVASLFTADIGFLSNTAWITILFLQISSYIKQVIKNGII